MDMQRSSESIGSLAAALANAQGELTNPEKSLVATIPASGPGGAEKIFRYASLSSGLDIVRKVLGQQEIATIQTTSLDQAAGIVNLTTLLAHASGEWIASDWPVCSVSDTANPHRMGAALTYARRYALFTLVGIAGEDDLDAPDLMAPAASSTGADPLATNGKGYVNNGGSARHLPKKGKSALEKNRPIEPPVTAEASATLRDRLMGELNGLGSGEDAALWAKRIIPERNKLMAADAERLDEAFHVRLRGLPMDPPAHHQASDGSAMAAFKQSQPRLGLGLSSIDKSTLSWPEPRRLRDREHVKFVAQHPCLVCGRQPADAHHLRFAQSRALGRKVSDEFTVPLCRGHHREVHRRGDEEVWWRKAGLDPIVEARTLWLKTHPLQDVSKNTDSEDLTARGGAP
jgi:ERF superfamily protein